MPIELSEDCYCDISVQHQMDILSKYPKLSDVLVRKTKNLIVSRESVMYYYIWILTAKLTDARELKSYFRHTIFTETSSR